jgi:hypothetical protein
LQVVGGMAGEVVSGRPDGLGDEHGHQEGGDWPPAAKERKDATKDRRSSGEHGAYSLPVVGRSAR